MPNGPITFRATVVKFEELKYPGFKLMYLIVPDIYFRVTENLLKARPTEKFNKMVRDMMMDYMAGEKAFEGPIMHTLANISDDMLAGREVTLRAGDYIALMEHGQKHNLI